MVRVGKSSRRGDIRDEMINHVIIIIRKLICRNTASSCGNIIKPSIERLRHSTSAICGKIGENKDTVSQVDQSCLLEYSWLLGLLYRRKEALKTIPILTVIATDS